MRIWLCVLLSLGLAGCGLTFQTKRTELLKTATVQDYGIPPPSGYLEIEKKTILKTLKDPDSARFEIPEPTEPGRDIIPADFASSEPVFVWITKINVNAKNSYGGYVGFQEYAFAWRDGKIYAVFRPYHGSGIWDYTMKQ